MHLRLTRTAWTRRKADLRGKEIDTRLAVGNVADVAWLIGAVSLTIMEGVRDVREKARNEHGARLGWETKGTGNMNVEDGIKGGKEIDLRSP